MCDAIALFDILKVCDAETREITLRPKGIRRYIPVVHVQLHSLEMKHNI
jgi:hypothetical protein